MKTEGIKPGKIYYVVSGVTLLVGIIIFVIILVSGIFSSVDKISNQVIVPGTKIIELKETGKYSIYFEYRSVIDGKVFETNDISGLMCSLRNTDTNENIEIRNTVVNSNYSINGREGKGIYEFTITDTGKYELKSWYQNGKGEEAVLAIGKGFGLSIVRTILACMVTLFVSLGLSITIFIVTLLKRQKDRNSI